MVVVLQDRNLWRVLLQDQGKLSRTRQDDNGELQSDEEQDADAGDPIQIAPDRTAKQREERKQLRDELERRKNEGEEDLVIRHSKIVKKPAGRGNPFQ